jgi:septal ring factor EnvC (AmiA/AmiB activator)
MLSVLAADKPMDTLTEPHHRTSFSVPVTASAATTAEMNDFAAKRNSSTEVSQQRDKQRINALERKVLVTEKAAADASSQRLKSEEQLAQARKEIEELKTQLDSLRKDSVGAYQKKVRSIIMSDLLS